MSKAVLVSESQGRRGSERYGTGPIPARLQFGAGVKRREFPVTLNCISVKGAQVRSSTAAPVGERVQLVVEGEAAVRAVVVRVLEAGKEGFLLGLSLLTAWSEAAFVRLAQTDEQGNPLEASSGAECLPTGCRPIPGFRFRRLIGQGGAGRVAEFAAPGGVAKAAKFVRIDPDNPLTAHELESLQLIGSIRHPYLLTVDRFHVEEDTLVVVMELADHNLLEESQRCLKQDRARIGQRRLIELMREAAEVLDLLNERYGVRHLDVKPENLFVVAGHVKVGDLGLARKGSTSDDAGSTVRAMSACYAAPELFDGRSTPSSDQYSLAVVYMELLTGKRPFPGANQRQLAMNHLTLEPDVSCLPAPQRAVLKRALARDPAKRFSCCIAFLDALTAATTQGQSAEALASSMVAMQTLVEQTRQETLQQNWRRRLVFRQLFVAACSLAVGLLLSTLPVRWTGRTLQIGESAEAVRQTSTIAAPDAAISPH
jgi:serine/threonine protein kinase